jgi:hypothetical protein
VLISAISECGSAKWASLLINIIRYEIFNGRLKMSHIRCPLCGKMAPISTFNPLELDLDLTVVRFKGLGRGRGFCIVEEYSVLGDEEFSPIVAERVLDICKMSLDAGVTNLNYVLNKLGMKPASPTPGEIPSLTKTATTQSSNAEIALAREAREKQEKELELERSIDRELLRFVMHYPNVVINADETPWTIDVTDVDEESLPVLFVLFGDLHTDIQKRLLKRLNTENPLVQIFLEIFTNRPKKTISERLLELDLSWVVERPDLDTLLRISKTVFTDDSSIQISLETSNKKREKTISERLMEFHQNW